MTENEKKLLVELICNEQTHMIIKDHTKYDTDKYKELEALKIKIKDMGGGYYECGCYRSWSFYYCMFTGNCVYVLVFGSFNKR